MNKDGRPFKRSGRRPINLNIEKDCEDAAQAYAKARGVSLSDAVNEAIADFFSVGRERKVKKVQRTA